MKANLASATSLIALLALQGGQGVATFGSLASSSFTAATALSAVTAAMAVSSPAEASVVTLRATTPTAWTSAGGGTVTIYDLVNVASLNGTQGVVATASNAASSSRSIRAGALSFTTTAGSISAGTASVAIAGSATGSIGNTYTFRASQRGSLSTTHVYTFGGNAANTSGTMTIVGSGVAPTANASVSNPYVLVGDSSATNGVQVTVTNSGNGNLAAAVVVASVTQNNLLGSVTTATGFTGGGSSVTLGDSFGGAPSTSQTFYFLPTSLAAKGSTFTGTTQAIFSNGVGTAAGAGTTVVTLTGTGVAPVVSAASASGGKILVGSSGSISVQVTNTGNGNLAGTRTNAGGEIISNLRGSFGTPTPGSSVFSGSGGSVSLGDTTSTTINYVFAPTSRGAVTTNAVGVFNNGSSNGANAANSVTTTLIGTGVAPVLNISNTVSAGYVLVGNNANAGTNVNNTGDGNQSGLGTISNLRGTLGSASGGGFSGAGTSVSLTDTTSTTYNYVFTPTSRGAATATVTSTFANGNAANGASTVSTTLIGTGVAPVLNLSSSASAGYVLVGQTGTMAVTVNNTGDGNLSGLGTVSNLRGTMGTAASSGFSGGGNSVSLTDTTSTSYTYVYTPTVRGAATVNVASNFANGSATNGAGTGTTALVGTGVAPINAVSSGNALVRIGTSGTASISVSNVGDGNLSGAGTISNLRGTYSQSLGAGFSAAAPSAISLADSASTTIGFTYNATSRTTSSASATITFVNGKSDGTNTSQVVSKSVSATGVGPTYASSYAGSNVTPIANNPTGSSIALGTLGVGYWQAFNLTLANITTDANGGLDALTDLTIESFNITGANASNFKIASGTGIIHKGGTVIVPIQVFSLTNSALVSTLTILTDQSAALGGIGDTFTYQLTAVAAPEPTTLAVLGAGLAGLAYARRKRRERETV